jgi:hypothetical protein
MSSANNTGFGNFVPGFDFLQNLAKGQGGQIPGMPSWVAPTMDPKEIDKRIEELKAVQFWLDQNSTALKATIQALEVQKMTLATLKSMNFDMGATASTDKSTKTESPVDPMQLWGSLTQQFQQIATSAMQEVAKQASAASAAAAAKKPEPAATAAAAKTSAAPRAPRKAAARKS